MPSKLELQVREMDDQSKSITKVAEEISQIVPLNRKTCENQLFAKRRGFESSTDYQNHLAKQRGFESKSDYQNHLAKQRGFESSTDYQNHLAKQRGFESKSDYQNHLAKQRGFESQSDYIAYLNEVKGKHPTADNEKMNYPIGLKKHMNRKQIDFEEDQDISDPSVFYQIEAPESKLIKNERDEYVSWLISNLDKKELKILSQRYELNKEEPKELREIGLSEGLTKQRIHQIEQKALWKLRMLIGRDNLGLPLN